ncbi:MAG: Biotin/lipoate A/B protein ligase [Caeruleum heppii]|nr:MAG: Biotin/lipoate A/B protein ligase [Caeruleum heppii]
MAPSRGFSTGMRLIRCHLFAKPSSVLQTRRSHGSLSSAAPAEFAALSEVEAKCQIYLSRSLDPYVNLSIEHYLLQKSPPQSTVLFLYIDRPCVVIGRNQNPWLEVNLPMLAESASKSLTTGSLREVLLVRRRSGGGTVFHDEGNVNYSVICPTSQFHRDKYAQVVASGLQKLGIHQAKVNKRHDIVLDGGEADEVRSDGPSASLPQGPTTGPRTRKISGSAYKLTRFRALHHATCLLSSPNLHLIHQYLHSLAKHYIQARGVESVSSPVANVNLGTEDFQRAVVSEFAAVHGLPEGIYDALQSVQGLASGNDWVGGLVDEGLTAIPEVKRGVEELKSDAWIYSQTPQFTVTSSPTPMALLQGAQPSKTLPSSVHISLEARFASIISGSIMTSVNDEIVKVENDQLVEAIGNRKIQDIDSWEDVLRRVEGFQSHPMTSRIARWLDMMLGR